ncbi:MAG: heme exporter protein CcmB [Oligoflexales bacterium]
MLNLYCEVTLHQLKLLFCDKERWVSPILFSITVLLLFSFAQGGYADKNVLEIFSSQIFLTLLFATQMALYRSVEPEKEDRIFDALRLTPLPSGVWFCSRCTLAFVLSLSVAVPVVLMGFVLHSNLVWVFLSFDFWALLLLVCTGLSCLGTLLAMLTFHADGREILFPLLFFPLSIPVLLAGLAGTKVLGTSDVSSWIGLVAGFNVIYFTLGVLLFEEFIGPS